MGSGGNNKINLIGQQFGRLVVVEEFLTTTNGLAQWVCLCECDEIIITSGYYLRQGRKKSCGCVNSRKRGHENPNWSGYGELSGSYWHRINQGAKSRNLPITIDIKYAYNLLKQQDYKCALSGLPICLEESDTNRRIDLKNQTASLDRIDSSKGYIEGNVQWLHKKVNTIKWNLDQDLFIKLCKRVADNDREPNK